MTSKWAKGTSDKVKDVVIKNGELISKTESSSAASVIDKSSNDW